MSPELILFTIAGVIVVVLVLISLDMPLEKDVKPVQTVSLWRDGEYLVGEAFCVGCGSIASHYVTWEVTAYNQEREEYSPPVCSRCYTIYETIFRYTDSDNYWNNIVPACDFCGSTPDEEARVEKPYWVCSDHVEKAKALL